MFCATGSQEAANLLFNSHLRIPDAVIKLIKEILNGCLLIIKKGGSMKKKILICAIVALAGFVALPITPTVGGLIDKTKAPNAANEGINKSLKDEIGAGRGSITTPKSSLFIINRDPFRAIRRGRQLFQRKFTREEGQGPGVGDGKGDVQSDIEIGAGFMHICPVFAGGPG